MIGSVIKSLANKYIKPTPNRINKISLPGYLATSPVIKSGIDNVGKREDCMPIFKIGIKTNIYSAKPIRSEEHTSELQSRGHLVCRLLLEKKTTDYSTG